MPSEITPIMNYQGEPGEVNLFSEIRLNPDLLKARKFIPDAPIPKAMTEKRIQSLSVTESGLHDALQLVLEGVGLTLRIEGGPRALERNGPVSVHQVSGSLVEILDQLSAAMGFFWSVDRSTIVIEPDRQMLVEMPPAINEDSLAGMTNTIQALGAKDLYLDRVARTLVYRANAKAEKAIDGYLGHVRATRSMIVYDMHVYQVDLKDTATKGISWSRLSSSELARNKLVSATSPLTAIGTETDLSNAFSATVNGSGLGVVVAGPNFSIEALVNFLDSQGTVRTVQRPRLTILNGGKGMLRVGQTSTFVYKVGSNISSGVSQAIVETKDLRTGMEMSVVGDVSDGTVFTNLSLSLADLTSFVSFKTLGTDLTLPVIDDRTLQTSLRLPPGYTALLGGITIQRQNEQRAIGVSQNTKDTSVAQSELVIVIRPTVVRFNKQMASTPTDSPLSPSLGVSVEPIRTTAIQGESK